MIKIKISSLGSLKFQIVNTNFNFQFQFSNFITGKSQVSNGEH